MTVFPTLFSSLTCRNPALLFTSSLKKDPFWAEPPSFPPPPSSPLVKTIIECPWGIDVPHSNEQWHRVEVRGKKIVLKGLSRPRSGAVVCSTLWNGCGKGLLRLRCRCYMGRYISKLKGSKNWKQEWLNKSFPNRPKKTHDNFTNLWMVFKDTKRRRNAISLIQSDCYVG